MKEKIKEENHSESPENQIPLDCDKVNENNITPVENEVTEVSVPEKDLLKEDAAEYPFIVGSYNPKKNIASSWSLNDMKKSGGSSEEDLIEDQNKRVDVLLESQSQLNKLLGDQGKLVTSYEEGLFFGDLEF